MAIAFAQVSPHTRSKGHSAIAGAAYRAGVTLLDERTGELHSKYENRADVLYSDIMLPEGADEKFRDREYLWNEVERCEKRKDSQVAKDIILALPKELNKDQWIELTRNFAHDHFVSKGIVADIAIHDNKKDNPHAHIYTTTRRLLGDKFDKYKARDLNPAFAKGFVVENDFMGEQWRDFQNAYFTERGLDLTVDQNQIIPQRHEGRPRGKKSHYMKEENRLRKAASVEIAVNDPLSLLNILSDKQAVFSERDINSIIFKNTDTKKQFQSVLAKLKGSKNLVFLGRGDDGRKRYTTRSNYIRETKLGEDADKLYLAHNHKVSMRQMEKASKRYGLNEEQKIALYHIMENRDITAVVGRAGSGKTYLMKPAKEVWEKAGYRVLGFTVAGKAAKGLEAESGIKSTTICSMKERIKYGSLNFTAKDIIVLDESGMDDLRSMSLFFEIAVTTGAKIVMVGDHDQLQPVGLGAPFRAAIERIGYVELRRIMRQKDPGDRQASIDLSKGHIDKALDYYDHKGRIHLYKDSSETTHKLIDDWKKNITLENISERIIIAHQNVDVDRANQEARDALIEKGLLSKHGKSVNIMGRAIKLTKGDQILFKQNSRSLGISNGDFAQVMAINKDKITVLVHRTGEKLKFSPELYKNFDYGYAATVHKTQGATFNNVYVYADGKYWNRNLTYVALTRHKNYVALYANKENHPSLDKLKTNLNRHNFIDTVLDFPLSFAIRRGFDPEKLVGRFIDQVAHFKQAVKDKWLYVVNYEAYLQQQSYYEKLETRQQRREEAAKVAQFVDIHRALGRKWGEMKNSLNDGLLKNDDIRKHPDYVDTYNNMLLRNQLGFELSQNLTKYSRALEVNNISIDTIKKAALEQGAYKKVNQYASKKFANQHEKQQLAQKILSDRRCYRYIYDVDVSWKGLQQDQHNLERQEILKSLPKEKLDNWRLVENYNQTRIDAGAAISKLIVERETSQKSPKSQQILCNELTGKRNALAYEIALAPEKYVEFLEKTNVKIEDIEKHAIAYSQKLANTDRKYNAKKLRQKFVKAVDLGCDAKTTKSAKKRLDYNAINNALMARGEEFYEHVLGFVGKKEGRSVRYGQGHALIYTKSGDKEGLWHSFSTNEGGAPIQLLMSTNHGWGLSYKDALKEGARLAGLTIDQASELDPVSVNYEITEKSLKAQIQKAEAKKKAASEKAQKIANARYYYNSAQPIKGTLGEKYLKEYRHIPGDIEVLRFHPRVKDPDTKTYHPAVVFAARDVANEITAVQAIMLNPQTGNKSKEVDVVKRTRGAVKGSAVLIHQGSGNEVIIAEGVETAASLITAKPKANIYATLGNIKNAAHLSWIADKHNTKEFYFAADNDGKNKQNINALKAVAKILKYEHNIACYMALPELSPEKEKYDFNDVLMEQSAASVKRQLAKMELIYVPERKEIIDKKVIHERLHKNLGGRVKSKDFLNIPNNIEWGVLAKIKNDTTEWLVKFHNLAKEKVKTKTADTKTIKNIQQSIDRLIKKIGQDEKLLQQLEAKAPHFVQFAKVQGNTAQKEQITQIDWFDSAYKQDWESARAIKSDNNDIKWFNKYYGLGKEKKQQKQNINDIQKNLNKLAVNIYKNADLLEKLKKKAPKLAAAINKCGKARVKTVDVSRDR
jgi:Ti-type conjugative transfer relaxase TraA